MSAAPEPIASLPRLTGRRAALRGFREDDFEALFSLHTDPEVMRYWSFPPWTEREQGREYFARALAARDPDRMLCWAIHTLDDDALIGTSTLFNINPSQGLAEIGYALGRAHWGAGIARDAVAQALDYAFDVLGVCRVEADIDPRNIGSMRLVEALRFRQEGLLRERWHVGGETSDTAFYGLLAREWRERSDEVLSRAS